MSLTKTDCNNYLTITSISSVTIPAVYNFIIQTKDPFLKFYTFSSLLSVAFLWLILWKNSGRSQLVAARLGLFIAGLFIGGAVVWRYLVVSQYIITKNVLYYPTGLLEGPNNYWPYFILLGPVLIVLMYLIFHYTKGDNKENRVPIFVAFCILLFFLVVYRLLWEWIDTYGFKILSTMH